MRTAFVLFALAALARAQDELFETVWSVGDDGELMGWPNPVGEVILDGNPQAVRVFDKNGLDACFEPLCAWAWGILLVPGPTDIASLCDPERHLKKTNQNLFDECLLMGVVPDAMTGDRTDPDPGRRRIFLDTLLGWRVLGERRLKEGAEMLKDMAGAETLDPITRLAAADIAAELDGRKPPMADLPPLDGVPADADVLAVVDQRRIPRWREMWRIHRMKAIRGARRIWARVGPAITPSYYCTGQWALDRECEAFYELARRFGNARVHRTVLGLMLPEDANDLSGAKILARCEGFFETDCFEVGCASRAVKHGRPREGAVSAQDLDFVVLMEPNRLLVSRNYAAPAAGGGIPADLAKLGLGGDDAIWIHCRRVPFADKLPVKGVETLTLRASFDGGVTVRCRAGFKDAESAKAAAAEMERWRSLDLTPVSLGPDAPFRDVQPEAITRVKAFLASLKVSVDGTTLTAECAAKGETPESLLRGVIDLEAIYDPMEGD
ncbi:MAG TPA: hypothetical protein VFY93_07275 [Planctomycetota bacterium]|nr:hypothetical protein [Planctomycetota bacterium]